MPTNEIPGRVLATRRAAADVTRAAVLGSYGITGFEAGPLERIKAALLGRSPGIRISVANERLTIDLRLRLAVGLPVAEVARQVDSAVRYAIRRAFGRDIDHLRIRIGGLESSPGTSPPAHHQRRDIGSSELADSGTDVA